MNIRAGLAGLLMLPMAMTYGPAYDTTVDLRVDQGKFEGVAKQRQTGLSVLACGRYATGTIRGSYTGSEFHIDLNGRCLGVFKKNKTIEFTSDDAARQAWRFENRTINAQFVHTEGDPEHPGAKGNIVGEFRDTSGMRADFVANYVGDTLRSYYVMHRGDERDTIYVNGLFKKKD